MGWQSIPLSASRIPGNRSGKSPNATAGASNASSRGIAEQRDCGGESAVVGPARTMRWRDVSDLARYKPKPAAVERASKHRGHRRVTIPAHFEHGRFVSGQFERRSKPIGRATGVNDEIAIGFRVSGLCETNPELCR